MGNASSPSAPCDRALALLRALDAGQRGDALYAISGSPDTLGRDLISLRRDLGVSVAWIPTERRYAITDWGVLKRSRVTA